MISIIVGIVLIGCGVLSVALGAKEELNLDRYVLKKKVVDSFKDVDWSKQVFRVNDEILKDCNGNTQFYGTKSVDDAITKMNEALK